MASSPVTSLMSDLVETTTATKETAANADIRQRDRASLLKSAERAKDPEEKARLLAEAASSEAENVDFATRHRTGGRHAPRNRNSERGNDGGNQGAGRQVSGQAGQPEG